MESTQKHAGRANITVKQKIDDHNLQLHIAITSGEIRNIIMGNNDRLDHSVQGECLNVLDEILSMAEPGELGIDYVGILQRLRSTKSNLLETVGRRLHDLDDHLILSPFMQDIILEKLGITFPSEANFSMSMSGVMGLNLPGTVQFEEDEEELAAMTFMSKLGQERYILDTCEREVDRELKIDILSRFINKAVTYRLRESGIISALLSDR
jgi:hypothetical protein